MFRISFSTFRISFRFSYVSFYVGFVLSYVSFYISFILDCLSFHVNFVPPYFYVIINLTESPMKLRILFLKCKNLVIGTVRFSKTIRHQSIRVVRQCFPLFFWCRLN